MTRTWEQRWQSALMDNYGTPPLTLVRGEGATVWDDEGRAYVDLVAGIAVNALGHAHPRVVEAVARQVATLGHTSNLVVNTVAVELAERLLGLTGRSGRVFFCNSGAEANETVFKLARLTGRSRMVVADGSFHGRTMGALALTAQPGKQEPFRPLPGEVGTVPFGDVDALSAAVDASTAALVLEPIQGEGGVVPAPSGYLAAAQAAARSAGALFALDEVQTGVGRTGTWFAYQRAGVEPDLVALAKGLGGGLPIGAVLAFGDAADLFRPGMHGSTFGGNPVACAASLAVLATIEDEGLIERVKQVGAALHDGVLGLGHPLVLGVRGEGLLLGIVLARPVAKDVEAALRGSGVLVNTVAPDVLRLAPPLVVTDDQVATFVDVLPAALDAVGGAS